jgi:hypothetical protein
MIASTVARTLASASSWLPASAADFMWRGMCSSQKASGVSARLYDKLGGALTCFTC